MGNPRSRTHTVRLRHKKLKAETWDTPESAARKVASDTGWEYWPNDKPKPTKVEEES